jgi:hypothetical protein
MPQPSPEERLHAYRQWRARVGGALEELDGWLEEIGYATDETRSYIGATRTALTEDRLRVAFVSGGDREKAALIDALFLDDDGRSLLPSGSGFANRCTAELCWEPEDGDACLRLLPIETHGLDLAFAQLRAEPTHWVRCPLDPQDPEQMSSRLRELNATRILPRAEAEALGLGPARPSADTAGGTVEVPKWRHGVVSFPSPLLRLGLAVLDIPHLAAPEVAGHMLSQAQVVVGIVAADHDLDGGQLEFLRKRLRGVAHADRQRLTVALSRHDPHPRQAEDRTSGWHVNPARIAAVLGLEAAQVFPVSVPQAIAARHRGDDALWRRSGVEALQAHILTQLLQSSRQAHLEGLAAGVGAMLERYRANLMARMDGAKTELGRLEALSERCRGLFRDLLDRTRQEQELSLHARRRLQRAQQELTLATQGCRDILDRDRMDALIAQVQSDLARRWTTAGMASAMMSLFDELVRAMQLIATETEGTRKQLREVYEGFARDLGFASTIPQVFLPRDFRVEIELLHQEADGFRHSPTLALAGQSAAIKQFDQGLVIRARALFEQLHDTFDAWVRDALQPLAQRVEDHRAATERRLHELQRLGRSCDDTAQHLHAGQTRHAELARQLAALRTFQKALTGDPALLAPVAAKLHRDAPDFSSPGP